MDIERLEEPGHLLEVVGPRELTRPKVAVLLAAGRSERMLARTGGGSKALLRLGGLTLLERAIRTLVRSGFETVVVVVGHHAGPVATVALATAPGVVRVCYADNWQLGNGASLLAAEPHVHEENSVLVVTVDHVFQDGALEALLDAGSPAVLIDPRPNNATWDEGTKVQLVGGRAAKFSKELEDPSIDCGAFVLTPSVFDAQRRAAARGSNALADAVSEFAAEESLYAVDIGGSWWQDVDTPDDLARAKEMLRGSLGKREDGPVSRFLNRPISTRMSIRAAAWHLSPDLVSWVVLAITVLAAYLLSASHGIAGGLLVQSVSIVDGVDGELARLELRSSPRGAFIDGVFDRVGDAAILVGLCVWAIHAGEPATTTAALGIAACAGAMLSMATKDRAAALGLRAAPERAIGWLLAGRDGRSLIVAVAAIAGKPLLGLGAVAVTAAVGLIVRFWFVVRRGQVVKIR